MPFTNSLFRFPTMQVEAYVQCCSYLLRNMQKSPTCSGLLVNIFADGPAFLSHSGSSRPPNSYVPFASHQIRTGRMKKQYSRWGSCLCSSLYRRNADMESSNLSNNDYLFNKSTSINRLSFRGLKNYPFIRKSFLYFFPTHPITPSRFSFIIKL